MRTTRQTSVAALLLVLSMAAYGQDPQVVEDDAGPLEQTVPVADESTEVAVADEAAPLSPEDALLAEFARFRELIY